MPRTDTPTPHIDNLVTALGGSGAPAGYKVWQGLGHKCEVEGPPGTVIPVNGDVYVDCDPFIVRRGVHFTGGNVVFAGDVIVEPRGRSPPMGRTAVIRSRPDSMRLEVFVRGGLLRKAGTATFVSHNSMWYLSATSQLDMEGGGRTLIWTSPTPGTLQTSLCGRSRPASTTLPAQAFLDLEGGFFTACQSGVPGRGGVQHQIKAQFVARKLAVVGQGVLIVRPDFRRGPFSSRETSSS